jgi:hypothetical protein
MSPGLLQCDRPIGTLIRGGVVSGGVHLRPPTLINDIRGDDAMTKLEQAFAEARKLPATEQEALGEWILDELASERRWQEAFARSQDALAQLADEALAEYRAGRTQELDPDRL